VGIVVVVWVVGKVEQGGGQGFFRWEAGLTWLTGMDLFRCA